MNATQTLQLIGIIVAGFGVVLSGLVAVLIYTLKAWAAERAEIFRRLGTVEIHLATNEQATRNLSDDIGEIKDLLRQQSGIL